MVFFVFTFLLAEQGLGQQKKSKRDTTVTISQTTVKMNSDSLTIYAAQTLHELAQKLHEENKSASINTFSIGKETRFWIDWIAALVALLMGGIKLFQSVNKKGSKNIMHTQGMKNLVGIILVISISCFVINIFFSIIHIILALLFLVLFGFYVFIQHQKLEFEKERHLKPHDKQGQSAQTPSSTNIPKP
jgi:cytochrome b subunit of formate dehydrogenase